MSLGHAERLDSSNSSLGDRIRDLRLLDSIALGDRSDGRHGQEVL